MKHTKFFPLLIVASMFLTSGCDKTGTEPVEPGIPVTPPEEPSFENGIYINEDGSVIVESDNGVDRINGLLTAIESCADQTVTASESGKNVTCNNTFILERNGIYYCEGKWTFTHDVTVKAANGDGNMPLIQIMADETGTRNADMILLEADARFEGIYFLGQEAMTGAHQQRMLRINGQGCKLTLDNCFADYCRNFFIYIGNTDAKVYLKNSTFRNMAYNASSNGRLVDTRGNGADTILIHNCIVYNNLGLITRFDGSRVNHLEWTNNTFYNVGSVPEIDQPASALIENNIFANVGWRNAGTAIQIDEETQLLERDDAFWNIETVAEGTDISNVKIIIRNNNVYNTREMMDLYLKYPETALAPTELSEGAKYLLEQGKLVFENNINEVLTYDNPAPIHYDFIDLYLSDPDAPDETFVGLNWFIDEDGITGIIPGQVYTFDYASSFESASASTTGGKLGATR